MTFENPPDWFLKIYGKMGMFSWKIYSQSLPELHWTMAKLNDNDSTYFQYREGIGRTSTEFLVQLQGQNSKAWEDFMHFYVPLIQYWCRRKNDRLTRAERQDILQDVLAKVSVAIVKFDLTREARNFRGWLRRITENRICDFLREKAKDENVVRLCSDPDHLNIPIQPPEMLESADHECEANEQCVLMKQVLDRIKSEFREKSWEVFHLLFVAERDSSEVAEMMNMKGDAVRQIRSRILKRIREEYAQLGVETDMLLAKSR